MEEEYILIREKRWWIPFWIFYLIVHWYRLFDLDVADWPWISVILTKKLRKGKANDNLLGW
jgi:hypothetical protein